MPILRIGFEIFHYIYRFLNFQVQSLTLMWYYKKVKYLGWDTPIVLYRVEKGR